MKPVALNLSRKWRSQNFDQIVGQDLVVRILKNSLYLGHYFPVYLFAGQRGCGKTSTARIFAAAVNCKLLSEFQKNPKQFPIPCLTCTSCLAMQQGNHPDFIEIDAASHTGVDNMRTIIESSSLLPIMGGKRVYLIDEAHMLSKAAFNAALKILEEPPATALFVLATTNPHKIIETVRSRCFQLFFLPIAHESLKKHLEFICSKEKIGYEDSALDMIIRHTEGSARDALNMLERVRFASATVSKDAVLKLLGHVSDYYILDIATAVLDGSAEQVLLLLQKLSVDHHSADFIWQRLMIVLRALLWEKHQTSSDSLISCADAVKKNASRYSLVKIHTFVAFLYSYEELFVKTTMQHVLLEMILLRFCHNDDQNDNDDVHHAKKKDTSRNDHTEDKKNSASFDLVKKELGMLESSVAPATTVIRSESEKPLQESNDFVQPSAAVGIADSTLLWQSFINEMVIANQPIISALFSRSRLISYDQENRKIDVEFAKESMLFKDWIDSSRDLWQPLMTRIFFGHVTMNHSFTGESKLEKNNKSTKEVTNGLVQKQTMTMQQYTKAPVTQLKKNEDTSKFSSKDEWPVASMLLKHFPGVITEICETS